MAAKYYIYRNLHKQVFSVKYRGKIIDHITSFDAIDVEFKVSLAGQRRVRMEGHRGVHAYVVCTSYTTQPDIMTETAQVYYNPFKVDGFVMVDTKILIHHADRVYGVNGKDVLIPC